MALDANIWIPIAFGAATGGLLGLHEERLDAIRVGAHNERATMLQRAHAEHVRPPIFVQIRPTAPRLVYAPQEQAMRLQTAEIPIVAAAPVPKAARMATPKKRALPPRTVPRETVTSNNNAMRAGEELTDADSVFQAESACARRDPEQCLRAARAFRLGIAIPPNPKSASIYWHSALRIYEDGCKRRDPVACVGQAAIYEKGKGEQLTRAPDLLERARGLCSDRYESTCDELDKETEKLRALVELPEGYEPIVK